MIFGYPIMTSFAPCFLINRLPTKSPLVLAMALPFALPAFAETTEPATDLGVLTVTATRANAQLKTSSQKVQIIDRETILNQLAVSGDTSEALAKLIPNYSPATQKLGTVGESFRGRDALFMIDGVPQSNPLRNGSRESRTIDLAMVDRIEVVYGASAEQGLGATGGIINFITKSNRNDGIKHEVGINVTSGNAFQADGLGGSVRYQASFGNDKTDTLVGIKYAKNGMYYQANGRMVGIYGNQGDVQGSQSYDVFAKVSHHLDDDKKLGVSVNHYHLEGSQDYTNVAGNRATGLTDTAVKYDGKTPQGKNPHNDVLTVNATFNDENFFGASLAAQAFYNRFSARYGANFAHNYQDPKLAPNGQLLDQSQNDSTKIGAKLTLNKRNLFDDRLSLTGGVDFLQDKTGQNLITYNRTWAPTMTYQNVAPFAQARLDLGRLSLSGGVRYEHGKLSVPDYQTLAGYTRNKSFGARQWTYTPVKGGELKFNELLPSVGLVYDFGKVQAFASYAKGYGMPDVGNRLRQITDENQSVASVNLEPIITDNAEVGVRFVDKRLSFDVSAFQSKSKLGQTIIPKETGDGYHTQREKTDIKGVEINARYQATKRTELTASYAHAQGKFDEDGKGVMVDMPARNISPDKLALGVNYKFDDGKRFVANATHLFGREYRRTDKVSDKFDGYTLLDVSYRQAWGGGEFSLGVNNLLNQHYDVFLTDVVLPTSDRYTGGQGRNYVVGYTRKF